MTEVEQYLVVAKTAEVTKRLRSEGFSVRGTSGERGAGWTLVATKGDRKVAVEVKVAGDLHASREEIRRLREQAKAAGFDEFRLVVVSPPRPVAVDVEALQEELVRYIREHMPEGLAEVSPHVVVDSVEDIHVAAITVRRDGIHVCGTGSVQIEAPGPGREEGEAPTISDVCPLAFEVDLDHDLRITGARRLETDVSCLRG